MDELLRSADQLLGRYRAGHRDLAGAHIPRAHLESADLAHVNLAHAHLEGANLENADLRHKLIAGALQIVEQQFSIDVNAERLAALVVGPGVSAGGRRRTSDSSRDQEWPASLTTGRGQVTELSS